MNKRNRKRKYVTYYEKHDKLMKRKFNNLKTYEAGCTQWAGFRCPSCLETSTEMNGFLFGGAELKCYACGFGYESLSWDGVFKATRIKRMNRF